MYFPPSRPPRFWQACLLGLAAAGWAAGLTAAETEVTTTFYVSPAGNDQWSGARAEPGGPDGPFATLTRAQQAIRDLKQKGQPTGDILVRLREGTYELAESLTFTAEDGGADHYSVTYAAYENERPVVSGGRTIRNWRKEKDLWVAELPGAAGNQWFFSQLFCNGQRLKRCRTPNTGYFRSAGPLRPPPGRKDKDWKDTECRSGFYYTAGDVDNWADLANANIFVFHSWTASVHWLKAVDKEKHSLSVTAGTDYPFGHWEKDQRYYIENVKAALDEPGEWYLDGAAGKVYYLPRAEDSLKTFAPVAPAVERLLVVSGDRTKNQPVVNLNFRGLALQHAAWNLPRDKKHDGQAAVNLTAAVYLKDAENCTFDRVEIAHVGQYALWFATGTRHCRLQQSELVDLGAGGVKIGETSSETPENAASFNVVDNCLIHDGGHLAKAGIGVWIGRSSYHSVTRNEICDFDYSAVSAGWSWGYQPSSANHNKIQFNRLHHIGNGVLSDMGGVYTLGQSPGTEVTHNVIHTVYAYSYGGWGLYTDEGSSDVIMARNVVYDTKSGGFHQHYGRDNLIRNNFLAFSGEGQAIRSREEQHISFIFENNIVVTDNGYPLGKNWSNGNFVNRNNLYWDVSGTAPRFCGYDLSDWQNDEGQDLGSQIADPFFRDLKGRDFHLQPDSPALALGIDSLDYTLDHAGLYGPDEWVQKPLGLTHRGLDESMRPPEAGQKAAFFQNRQVETLEELNVGDKIAFASTSGEDNGASIRVTDELGRQSKHSLKFTDADDLTHEWQPHLSGSLNWRKGTIKASFDLYLKPGARFWHEWRMNQDSGYKVGVCLRFTSEGRVLAGAKLQDLAACPVGQWVKVELVCPLGQRYTGKYELTLTPEKGQAQHFELPLQDPEWRALTGVIFSSEAKNASEFYLDNIHFVKER